MYKFLSFTALIGLFVVIAPTGAEARSAYCPHRVCHHYDADSFCDNYTCTGSYYGGPYDARYSRYRHGDYRDYYNRDRYYNDYRYYRPYEPRRYRNYSRYGRYNRYNRYNRYDYYDDNRYDWY